jgi:hypothetical protein
MQIVKMVEVDGRGTVNQRSGTPGLNRELLCPGQSAVAKSIQHDGAMKFKTEK